MAAVCFAVVSAASCFRCRCYAGFLPAAGDPRNAGDHDRHIVNAVSFRAMAPLGCPLLCRDCKKRLSAWRADD